LLLIDERNLRNRQWKELDGPKRTNSDFKNSR
jgi:hypothetical protein